jgi:hypothetical protein
LFIIAVNLREAKIELIATSLLRSLEKLIAVQLAQKLPGISKSQVHYLAKNSPLIDSFSSYNYASL